MTDAERAVLERRRSAPTGMERSTAAALLDHDRERTLVALTEEEATLSRDLARSLPPDPDRFGFSPCDFASLAAYRVLTHPPLERDLASLAIAFRPPFATTMYTGCAPLQREVALALLSFLGGDDPGAAKRLARVRPQVLPLPDSILVRSLSHIVVGRVGELPALFQEVGPEYEAAMARGLWRTDPEAFLHVRLLAALQAGRERGLLDLAALPDTIPYVPLWLIR
jgi:hypothetical protein